MKNNGKVKTKVLYEYDMLSETNIPKGIKVYSSQILYDSFVLCKGEIFLMNPQAQG